MFNSVNSSTKKVEKMKKQNDRISTRLTDQERQRIEQLVGKGQFKNLSAFLRCAIERLLENTQES
jgi:Arc/MetJ-type ribon-helix-helix transcriptional regulator